MPISSQASQQNIFDMDEIQSLNNHWVICNGFTEDPLFGISNLSSSTSPDIHSTMPSLLLSGQSTRITYDEVFQSSTQKLYPLNRRLLTKKESEFKCNPEKGKQSSRSTRKSTLRAVSPIEAKSLFPCWPGLTISARTTFLSRYVKNAVTRAFHAVPRYHRRVGNPSDHQED